MAEQTENQDCPVPQLSAAAHVFIHADLQRQLDEAVEALRPLLAVYEAEYDWKKDAPEYVHKARAILARHQQKGKR